MCKQIDYIANYPKKNILKNKKTLVKKIGKIVFTFFINFSLG